MSMYESLYYIVEQYIYGFTLVGTPHEVVAILIATIGCLFMFALPFCVVWKVIKLIVN